VHLGRNTASKHEGAGYTIAAVAGNGKAGFGDDGGPAAAALLNRPCAVATDGQGSLFIADYGNNRIRKVGADGTITTYAGTGEAGFAGDGGPATAARLRGPYGVSVDRQGNLYVADQCNERVRKIARDAIISTVAGNGTRGYSGDGGPATAAALAGPDAVVVDDRGDFYIADARNHRVRKVTAGHGVITTVMGTSQGYSGDGGPATRAQLNLPASLALDAHGNLYVGDLRNHVIRKMNADGVVQTVAGTGEPGFDGDGGPATRAKLNQPGGVAIAPDGSLLIADGANFRVRRVGLDGVIETIAGSGSQDRSAFAAGSPAERASLSVLDILDVDRNETIHLTDHGQHRVHRLTSAR
jgi:sugar lactone lactonase YvrE